MCDIQATWLMTCKHYVGACDVCVCVADLKHLHVSPCGALNTTIQDCFSREEDKGRKAAEQWRKPLRNSCRTVVQENFFGPNR